MACVRIRDSPTLFATWAFRNDKVLSAGKETAVGVHANDWQLGSSGVCADRAFRRKPDLAWGDLRNGGGQVRGDGAGRDNRDRTEGNLV
jgi:hypothetical protein